MDIGRAARASGVSAKMIRHYEAIGLLKNVARTYANYRVYTANEVHEPRFIKRSRSSAAVKRIARDHIAELKVKIAELQSIVATLEHLAKHCHGDHRPECPILDELAAESEPTGPRSVNTR